MLRTAAAFLILIATALPVRAIDGLKNLLIGHWTYGGAGCDSGLPIAFTGNGKAVDQTMEATWTVRGNEIHFKGRSFSDDLPRDPKDKGEPFETIWKVMKIGPKTMTVRLAGGNTTTFTRC